MDVMWQSSCLVINQIKVKAKVSSLIAGWWVRPQTQTTLHDLKLTLIGGYLKHVFGWANRGLTWGLNYLALKVNELRALYIILCFIIFCKIDLFASLWWCIAWVRKPPCELNNFCVLTTSESRVKIWPVKYIQAPQKPWWPWLLSVLKLKFCCCLFIVLFLLPFGVGVLCRVPDRLYINRKTYYNLPNSAFWGWLSMESQPQNPEFRNNPENFHPCYSLFVVAPIWCGSFLCWILVLWCDSWCPF